MPNCENITWGNSRECWATGTDKNNIGIVSLDIEKFTDYKISPVKKVNTIIEYNKQDINKTIDETKKSFNSVLNGFKIIKVLIPTILIVYIYKGLKNGK
jgi:hypothetical protein